MAANGAQWSTKTNAEIISELKLLYRKDPQQLADFILKEKHIQLLHSKKTNKRGDYGILYAVFNSIDTRRKACDKMAITLENYFFDFTQVSSVQLLH